MRASSIRDLFDLENESGFDLIWIEQAFHHVEPRSEVTKMLSNLLRRLGHVVTSETNAWHPAVQFGLLRKRGLRTIRERVEERGQRHLYGHERVTTASRICRQFAVQGFEEVARRHYRLLPGRRYSNGYAGVKP